jgi:hypothetical protein
LSDTSMSQGDEFSDESVPEEFCDPITLMLMVPARLHSRLALKAAHTYSRRGVCRRRR